MSPICNECDEPYESNGDCSGICESCRDEVAHRRMIDAMSESEYVAYKAALLQNTAHSIIRALTTKKAA